MSSLILKALYFFLPAYLANMAPILLRWIPWGNIPINEKLLGKNKTWRGLILAVIVGGLVFWFQKVQYLNGFTKWAVIDYADFSLALGYLLGAGAILGDLVKSYYKRKAKIKPGKPWPFWDQLDFVFGGLLFSFFIYVPPVEVALVIVVFTPALHLLANYVGYLLKINKSMF